MTNVSAAVLNELAPGGRLRVGINFSNALLTARDPVTRAPSGIALDLAWELGRRLGVPVDIVSYESAGALAESASRGEWEVGFLGAEPQRANEIDFTAAYLEIEATYLVPPGSSVKAVEEVDRAGMRVMVGAKAAYDLYLTRNLQHASLDRANGAKASFDAFVAGRYDALAGLRPQLVSDAEKLPGSRVLEGRFTAVQQAVGTPKGHDAGARYLREYVEDVKAKGRVAQAIADNKVRGVTVCAAGAAAITCGQADSFSVQLQSESSMRIEVICTGDEVLTGKIVNTNFSYISQKLEDFGLSVEWETTVGDDRENLLLAFQLAGQRADAVIVNGGLGPTVDDLSQEIAAQAAGVPLALSDEWLTKMTDYFKRRQRPMPASNRKQAMLPEGAEIIDNPVGTACGFALDIGRARFFFTPGVPREVRRMLEEQIIPRLLARSGRQTAIFLKRFHSYGLGESHVDMMLKGVEEIAPQGGVKLGFRAHYPQLETKLMAQGADMDAIRKNLAPVEAEVRKRLGNFILAEDDRTLEGVLLEELKNHQATLAVVETFTGGQIAGRLAHLPGAEKLLRRGIVTRDIGEVCAAVGLERNAVTAITQEAAATIARAAQKHTGATHALSVLIELDDGADRIEFAGTICLAIANGDNVASRRSRILGGRDWVRLGAIEMGLDCLRRYLQKLPVDERIDFEKVENM